MHDLNYILTELIFILLHFIVLLANYFIIRKNIFYPPVLFSLVWFVIILLHFIFGFTVLGELYPLSIDTFVLLLIGTIFFSIGSVIVNLFQRENDILKSSPTAVTTSKLKLDTALRMLFLGIAVIGLPLYIQASFRVFLASQIDNFFVGLRTELSYGEEDIGPSKYFVSFSFIVFAINYYAFLLDPKKINKIMLIVGFIVAVVYSVFATGRTYFFMLLAIYLGISFLIKKGFSIKKYAWALLLFIPIFIFIGMIYGKGGDADDSFKNNLNNGSETTAIYLVSSINALDNELSRNIESNYQGDNTLLFFVKIGKQLNLIPDKKVGSLLAGFVFVPYPTNVYTVYSPYIRDFGRLYAFFMIGLFGALHTWVYFKALKTRNLRNTLYYCFLLYPLLMSFFQDQYMSLFSTWLQMIFYTEIFLLAQKYLPQKKPTV